MANLQHLLRRQSELELDPGLEARVLARLASIHDPAVASAAGDLAESDDAPATGDPAKAGSDAEPVRDAGEPVRDAGEPARDASEPVRDAQESVRAAGEPVEPTDPATPEPVRQEPIGVAVWSTPAAAVEPDPAAPPTGVDAMATTEEIAALPLAVRVATRRPRAARGVKDAGSDARHADRPDSHGGAPRGATRRPRTAGPVASCPYCANVLQPPPAASRRCPRCRQRIVVRRLADRAVYLTEAAVPVFEAERRRLAHSGRWTRERDRWLHLALTSGAPANRVARLGREPIAEGVVTAARALYMSTVDRSFRVARRDRRWEEAARIRFEQALTLLRLAASRVPPPEEVVLLHRAGLAAALRGIGEIARSAELRAGTCCEACLADDGQVVRIADELRNPRLPHPACPKGLCRCRWYIADADRAIVTTLLKRQARAHRRRGETRPSAG